MTPSSSLARPWRWTAVAVVFASVATIGWYSFDRDQPVLGSPIPAPATDRPKPGTVVEVVTPTTGGLDRICVQPGTVEPFESADLYVKVSGFLVEQTVDIGAAVKKGDVLARVVVPEFEKQIKVETADVDRAAAKEDQAKSAVHTAEAELGAATAGVALAKADLGSKAAFQAFRHKQRERVRNLHAQDAIDAKLVDEQEHQFQSAVAAELSAQEGVAAAKQREAAARARVEQAKAELKLAGAEVAAARARLEKAAVMLDYTVVRSPYTGVVTKRNFHPGDFIRSADGGDRVPVLAVERTDVMRVVIQVPDRDVPYVNPGDPATVSFDALPGQAFHAAGGGPVVISRSAASEDAKTKTMRTEVDVQNPDGRLRRGMYGLVTLHLHTGHPTAARVPSAALVGKAEGGKATVRVARGGKVQLVPVRFGVDTGAEVEILSGLAPGDRVVVRASGPVDDGTAVTVTEAKTAGGH